MARIHLIHKPERKKTCFDYGLKGSTLKQFLEIIINEQI